MDTEQKIFDDAYENTLAALQAAALQPDFTLQTVRNELAALYKYEGLDWTGRGDIKQAEISGSILAYQVFLKRSSTNTRKEPHHEMP
jgi:hypothetical protein